MLEQEKKAEKATDNKPEIKTVDKTVLEALRKVLDHFVGLEDHEMWAAGAKAFKRAIAKDASVTAATSTMMRVIRPDDTVAQEEGKKIFAELLVAPVITSEPATTETAETKASDDAEVKSTEKAEPLVRARKTAKKSWLYRVRAWLTAPINKDEVQAPVADADSNVELPTPADPKSPKAASPKAADPKKVNVAKIIMFLLIGLFVIAVIILGTINLLPKNEKTAVTTTTPAAITTETGKAEFKQDKIDLNSGNKVDTLFAKAFGDAQEKIAAGAEEKDALKNAILDRAGHNAHALAIWSYEIGGSDLWADPNNWKTLVDGDYLSPEGEKLHAMLEGVLVQNGTRIVIGEAKTTDTNSGVDNGVFGYAAQSGISKDRTAAQVTTPTKETTIMKRCGNIARHGGDSNVPTVNTDENIIPPVTIATKPAIVLTPKDSDLNKYKKHGDDNMRDSGIGTKPKIPFVTEPATAAKTVVVKVTNTVNNITDSSTAPLGTESGLQSINATPYVPYVPPTVEQNANPSGSETTVNRPATQEEILKLPLPASFQ